MAREKKPSGRLSSGPWTSSDFKKMLTSEGYRPAANGDHLNWKHPDRSGKVQLSPCWTGVKKGHSPFVGISGQMGISQKDLQKLLNKHCG
jgi:hypothetical protein